MHPGVANRWNEFSIDLEGRFRSMYLDVLELVTCGVGNLIDPIGLALGLPWRRPDGRDASPAEIRKDWEGLKARPELARMSADRQARFTSVRLTGEDIDELVARRRLELEADLLRSFPGWHSFPADAQLGILSMAWAMGSGFPHKFPRFTAAANAGAWLEAAGECDIDATGNAGVAPRNAKNRICFANAAAVLRHGWPVAELHWPLVAASPEVLT